MIWLNQKRKLKELIPYERNPRKVSDEKLKLLKKRIEELGYYNPIILDKDNTVLAGHQRLKILSQLGEKEVDVRIPEKKLSKKDKDSIIVGDNLSIGEFDFEILQEDFSNKELEEIGFDIEELPELEPEEGLTDDDEVPEVPDTPKSKLGDIWILGNHRVMCGDSTKESDVEKLMNGEKADMVFTDPPYGMDLDTDYQKMPISPTGAKPIKYRKIIGDNKPFDASFIMKYFGYCKEIFLFGADYFIETVCRGNKNLGSWFVWDKRVTENFDKMFGSAFELCWSKNKHKREIARFNNTLYSGEVDAKNKLHPTQKPIKLIEWFFERIESGKVVDLFLGSGSTLIVCEKTNRICYGMEIDLKYIDVIIKRWQDYTGKEAYRESDNIKFNSL